MTTTSIILLTAFVLVISCNEVWSQTSLREKEAATLAHMFAPNKYDKRIRPHGLNTTFDITGRNFGHNNMPRHRTGADGPVVVAVNAYIRSITAPNPHTMDYEVQLTLRQMWVDDRLRYDEAIKHDLPYLTLRDHSLIWLPDLFFSNSRNGTLHSITSPNLLIRITDRGEVLWSARITVKLICNMDLSLFPFDRHNCSGVMSSYSYRSDELTFVWKEFEPLKIADKTYLAGFTMASIKTNHCHTKSMTGDYSCIRWDVVLKREMSHFVGHTFLPSILVVIISWIPFWLNPRASVIRLGIGAISFVVVWIISSETRYFIPPVSYTVAADVWNGVNMIFLLAAVIEYAFVVYLADDRFRDPSAVSNEATVLNDDGAPKEKNKSIFAKQGTSYGRLDVISRIVFPIAYVLFNIVFWATYATAAARRI